jgi:hypothetical protein
VAVPYFTLTVPVRCDWLTETHEKIGSHYSVTTYRTVHML